MKKLLAVALLTTLPAIGVAADNKNGYFEFGVGKSSFDVSTKTYSGASGGVTYSNFKGTFDYDDPTTYGFEIGSANFLGTPLRVGFGIAAMKAELNKATGTGTVTTGDGTVNLAVTATAADLRGIGVSYDNDVRIYGVNAYYDFPTNTAVKPFVGFGVGLADIENGKDKEFTWALHAGVNYDLTKELYLGAKVSRYTVSGPTDSLGLTYEDIDVTYYGLQLGLRF